MHPLSTKYPSKIRNKKCLNTAALMNFTQSYLFLMFFLVSERSDEINQCYDEYYPIHQSTLHDIKFLELLIQCGADTNVRTSTQETIFSSTS
jgi:hypothetical protein